MILPLGHNLNNVEYFKSLDMNELLQRQAEARNFWFKLLLDDKCDIVTLAFWQAIYSDVSFAIDELRKQETAT
jgi:hypothetical protein